MFAKDYVIVGIWRTAALKSYLCRNDSCTFDRCDWQFYYAANLDMKANIIQIWGKSDPKLLCTTYYSNNHIHQ